MRVLSYWSYYVVFIVVVLTLKGLRNGSEM